MNPKKTPGNRPEGDEIQAIEERVKRMLDPSVLDEPPVKPPFEIIKDNEEPGTAPEVPGASLKKPIKIELKDNSKAEKEEPHEDPETSKVVQAIEKSESDELLKVQDEEIAKAFDDKKPNIRQRIKNALSNWWHNKKARNATILGLVLTIIIVFAVPYSRYFVLNNVGVRVSASVIVQDKSTNQPLRNVVVSLYGQTAFTDQNGYARLEHIKLGSAELSVEKRAFASVKRKVTLGLGSNPLGNTRLTPVGSQYSFIVTDFLSTKPLEKVEALSGEYSAFSDSEGRIKLTVDQTNDSPLTVTIHLDEYRDEVLTLQPGDETESKVKMVPDRQHVFISKRSGKYDVYKIDADGKNEVKVLAGTGSERDDMVLVPHPSENLVALVSTRGNARNDDGFLLSTLTFIDLSDKRNTTEVAQSERIQVVGWVGDRLIYVRIAAGASAAKDDRHRLISYDFKTLEYDEIAKSNFFNDVMLVNGSIFFAPSSAYQAGEQSLFKTNADGSGRTTAVDKEVWNIFRTSYDRLTVSVGQRWYEYDIPGNTYVALEGEPADLLSRSYVDSPNGKKSIWVDQRDGKGALIVYDIATAEEKVLYERSGLKVPMRWLNNTTVVFRVNTEAETADYTMSLNGDQPRKIRDVTNTSGLEKWYYY